MGGIPAVDAQAQTPPAGAAGELLRRQQALAGQREPIPTEDTLQAPAIAGPAVTPTAAVRITSIAFPPSHFLSKDELDALAAPYRNRDLTTADLQALIDAINGLYDRRGILTARAVLPPQDYAGGVLRIDLFEGKVGRLTLSGQAYVRESYLTHQAHLAPGDTIDPTALRNNLWRFNRLSDVQLRAALAPGDAPGLTNVDLTAVAPKRDRLTLFVDNHAYDATGTYEGGALYRHTGLLGVDDRLSALVTASRGAITGTASYDLPIGADGTRFGLSYGHSITRVIAGAYAAYGSKGIADSVIGELSQPLLSSGPWLIQGLASGGYTRTRNYLAGTLVSTTGTSKGSLGIAIAYQGTTNALNLGANATWAHGEIENGRLRDSYPLVSGSAAFTQSIAGPISISATGAWQWTSATGLPSDLLFQIGGPTTIRGYTQGALAGDKGYYAEGQVNLALAPRSATNATLFAFIDTGHVTASFAQPNALTSAGIGATVRLSPRVSVDTSLGHALRNKDLGPGKIHAYARLTWDIF